MTSIVCISDLHEHLVDVPACDLLLIAGDVSYAFKGDLATKGGYEHVGSTAMTTTLERVRPQLMVCGHIHPGYGRYRLVDTGDRERFARRRPLPAGQPGR